MCVRMCGVCAYRYMHIYVDTYLYICIYIYVQLAERIIKP